MEESAQSQGDNAASESNDKQEQTPVPNADTKTMDGDTAENQSDGKQSEHAVDTESNAKGDGVRELPDTMDVEQGAKEPPVATDTDSGKGGGVASVAKSTADPMDVDHEAAAQDKIKQHWAAQGPGAIALMGKSPDQRAIDLSIRTCIGNEQHQKMLYDLARDLQRVEEDRLRFWPKPFYSIALKKAFADGKLDPPGPSAFTSNEHPPVEIQPDHTKKRTHHSDQPSPSKHQKTTQDSSPEASVYSWEGEAMSDPHIGVEGTPVQRKTTTDTILNSVCLDIHPAWLVILSHQGVKMFAPQPALNDVIDVDATPKATSMGYTLETLPVNTNVLNGTRIGSLINNGLGNKAGVKAPIPHLDNDKMHVLLYHQVSQKYDVCNEQHNDCYRDDIMESII